jgi:hypothetical protein
MIYSPDHNFLLLKNRKVGGSSLEVALAKVLPDNAVVTHLNNIENTMDSIPKGHKAKNITAAFYNHMSYLEAKKELGFETPNSYVFVRHPYNAVLSAFFHRIFIVKNGHINKNYLKELSNIDLKDLIKEYFSDRLNNLPWYKSDKRIFTDFDGNSLVTKILYYEKGIEEEINPVLNESKISSITVDVFVKQHRPKNITYLDVFSEEHLEMIRKEWSWEFKNLDYKE